MLDIGCVQVSVVHRRDMRRYLGIHFKAYSITKTVPTYSFCLLGLCVRYAWTSENVIPSFLEQRIGLMGINLRLRSQRVNSVETDWMPVLAIGGGGMEEMGL